MKKKTLALLLALVMALSLLAGCGGDNNTPSNPDTPPAGTQTPDTPLNPPSPRNPPPPNPPLPAATCPATRPCTSAASSGAR